MLYGKRTKKLGTMLFIALLSCLTCKLGAACVEKPGKLTVFYGPMCSGKSRELFNEIDKLKRARLKVLVCKHAFDTRAEDSLKSRSYPDMLIKAFACSDPSAIFRKVEQESSQAVAIDEVQFFDTDSIIPVVDTLLNHGVQIAVAGLNTDFRRRPFGCMGALLAMATKVRRQTTVCAVCKDTEADCTQRLRKGQPVPITDPLIAVDDGRAAEITYEPRCRRCHQLPLQ